jgi:hypothetical protein
MAQSANFRTSYLNEHPIIFDLFDDSIDLLAYFKIPEAKGGGRRLDLSTTECHFHLVLLSVDTVKRGKLTNNGTGVDVQQSLTSISALSRLD